METKGIISNIQRFSLHDGPGIRTTVFFKGCTLRCFWCHNPETYRMEQELCYKKNKCIGCGQCIKECEKQALCLEEGLLRYIEKNCIHCFECANNCPSKALFVCGQKKTVEDVFREVIVDKDLYVKTHGGVTFSGGEATAQNEFLNLLIQKLKAENIHIALDTCGFCNHQKFVQLVQNIDLCLFDIKHTDDDIHRELTGVGNKVILENLKYLNKMGIITHIRVPVIPGYNDGWDNYDKLCEILKPMNMIEEIMLLGYHKLGLSKVYQFNQYQEERDIVPPTNEKLQEIQRFLQERLPNMKIKFR